MLILSLPIWALSCSQTPIRVKPNGALTVPIEKETLDSSDTPRTLLIKFTKNLEHIDEANKRFEKLRK